MNTIKTAKAKAPKSRPTEPTEFHYQDGHRVHPGIPVFDRDVLANNGIQLIELEDGRGFALQPMHSDHERHEMLCEALTNFGIENEAEMETVLRAAYNATMWSALRKSVRNL